MERKDEKSYNTYRRTGAHHVCRRKRSHDQGPQGETVKVDARGLNLASVQGQEVLDSRLRNAAKQVCGATSFRQAGSLKRALENRECFDEALTRAVESVGNEGLTEIHKTS